MRPVVRPLYALSLAALLTLVAAGCDVAAPEAEPSDRPAAPDIPSFKGDVPVSVPRAAASVTQGSDPGQTATASVPLADGWNLVSVPLESSASFGEDFPMCSSAFVFNTGEGYDGLSDGETLPAGRGAFVNCSAGTATVDGTAPSPSVSLSDGWNLIGALDQTVATEALTASPPGILETSFFAYDPSGGYAAADSLRPGNGYWVKASASGTLEFNEATLDTVTTTLQPHTVGGDLYDTDYPGLDNVTVSHPDTSITVDLSDGAETVQIPVPNDVDSLSFAQDDEDYIATWMMNNTATESAPDLTVPHDEMTGFPAEPDHQSNYAQHSNTAKNTITLHKDSVVASYEARVIPSTSPEGYNTMQDWAPNFNSDRVRRFKQRVANGDTLNAVLTGVVEENPNGEDPDSTDLAAAEENLNTVVDLMPYPIDLKPRWETTDAWVEEANERGQTNISRTFYDGGSPGNAFVSGNVYAEFSSSSYNTANNETTRLSEIYSSLTGMGTVTDGDGEWDPNNKIFDQQGNLITSEASWAARVIWSKYSASDL